MNNVLTSDTLSDDAPNQILKDRFLLTRHKTEQLCEPLNVEDYIPQAYEFASPPKWHLGHTSWFFEEMVLVPYADSYTRYDEDFQSLFNSYYQSLGRPATRAERGIITRPTVAEVYRYRTHITECIAEFLDTTDDDAILKLIELGVHHEQQHQELLLTDLKLAFSLNPKYPVYHDKTGFEQSLNQSDEWLEVSAGLVNIGSDGEAFCFDNELVRHAVYLQDFSICKGLVTNADWMEFINAGGYHECELWLDEGWQWVREAHITSPLYWLQEGNAWLTYTLAGLQALEPGSAVMHISYYEADAYARWKQARLPSEFEWEAAADKLDWGARWEWTSSAYQAYPGFKPGAGAVGEYNGKFMANQFVLRGASVATAEGHSRTTYRNFFHPHHQWQYSGLRLAK